jgi:WhiB family transcriptional regulator, redox-sensing transcriptional regulator
VTSPPVAHVRSPRIAPEAPQIAPEAFRLPRCPVVADQAQEWRSQASCKGIDPDLFFPDRGAATGPAKAVCAGCAVRADCLEYALEASERFGIWGGMSERERRGLRRARRRMQ